ITTDSQETFRGEELIFARGIEDQMPAIKGFEDCRGVAIIYCPYCYGYVFRNHTTGIFANVENALNLASLVSNLTNNLTILTNGKADFSVEQLEKLKKKDIKIISTQVAEIAHENGHVKHVVFQDGKPLNFDAIYAAIPFVQHTEMPV